MELDQGQPSRTSEFPSVARVRRTRFARQAADLWRVKQLLHRRLLALLPCLDL